MNRVPTALVIAAAMLILAGFDGCPLAMDTNPPVQQDAGPITPTLDIGGTNGAYWGLSYGKELVVTARSKSKVATKQVKATIGVLSILNSNINITGFCLRADTLCPADVLPSTTRIVQVAKTPWNPLLGFNRTGPLRIIKDQAGLIGILKNDSLKVPMATSGLAAAKGDYCALVVPSSIDARVLAQAGGGSKADTIQGKITMAYASECWNLGGGSTVTPGTAVSLTVDFIAKRK